MQDKDDSTLRQRINSEVSDALGYYDELSRQREEAQKYYYGEPMGNEVEGRSHFVDSSVQDAVEWIKPSLMRVFASGDDFVKFEPVGPEDQASADQATDYVNYVVTKDNPGWEILYSWFHDALLLKNGIIKVWWEVYEEEKREEYKGISEVEFDSLLLEENTEILTQEQSGELFDLTLIRTTSTGRIKIANVPPEEFLIARDAKDIADSRFVCHRVRKTLSDLTEMYPDEDLDPKKMGAQGPDMGMFSSEYQTRHRYDASFFGSHDKGFEPEDALKEYWLYESYLKTDWDEDGIAELRRVCSVGNLILENEPVDDIPFISVTPIKIPHKFFGMSIADVTMPLQSIKSTLLRNLLDNMYNQNFGRFAVLEGQANLDDLLTARPGGIVRVKSPNAVTPLATPALEPYTFQMLQYVDEIRENRTGVSKTSQGLNPDLLTSHTTATAVDTMMTASQTRIELVARNFAETGVKDLMLRIYNLLLENQDKPRMIRLRNNWVEVNPDGWSPQIDLTVSVALGNGNKQQQIGQLNNILQMATQAQNAGNPMISQENIYNISTSLLKAMGYQDTSGFITPPQEQQQPQPTPEAQKMQADQQKMQADQQKDMAELSLKAAKLDLDKQEFEHRKGVDQFEANLKSFEAQLEGEGNQVKIG